jgi:hypothetical protein
MNSTLLISEQSPHAIAIEPIRQHVNRIINELIASLPDHKTLAGDEQRGIIARYTAVLEGNFIYWMTAAYLAAQSEEARSILLDNLREEVRDAHPAMLRRFAIAAMAFPMDSDSLAVHDSLTNVRLFFGRLSGVQSILAMAFFEGFIQRFMGYLAGLAAARGSVDMEYTDVHGVCDIAHAEGLYQALSAEMTVNPLDRSQGLFEGVDLLRALIGNIVFNATIVRTQCSD